MGTIANAKVTHYYNCYNGDFIGCLQNKICEGEILFCEGVFKICEGEILMVARV